MTEKIRAWPDAPLFQVMLALAKQAPWPGRAVFLVGSADLQNCNFPTVDVQPADPPATCKTANAK